MTSRLQAAIDAVRALPVDEQLSALDAIWDDISSAVPDLPLSTADRQLLDERLTQEADAPTIEWSVLRQSILNARPNS
jgi:hypothetical protein